MQLLIQQSSVLFMQIGFPASAQRDISPANLKTSLKKRVTKTCPDTLADLISEFDIVMICVTLATEAVTWLRPGQLFVCPVVICCYLSIAQHDLHIGIALKTPLAGT